MPLVFEGSDTRAVARTPNGPHVVPRADAPPAAAKPGPRHEEAR
jgi:hypothetical protein